MMPSRTGWLVLASLLVACTSAPRRTQLLVTIDADPDIAADTWRLDLEVRGGLGDDLVLRHEQTLRRDEIRWPLVVALAPLEGDASRIQLIEVRARDERDMSIGRVRARTGFAPGSVRMLALRLDEPCRFVHGACEVEQTCREGGCESADVDVQTLPEYIPRSTDSDAGIPDASAPRDASEHPDADTPHDASVPADGDADVVPPDAGPVADPLDCGDCFYAIDSLRIPDQETPGVVEGFDLDGRVSHESDVETCGHPDFTSPDLVPGIDNQLADLKPTLDMFFEEFTLDEHFAGSLALGDPIILIEILGVRSVADRDVTVNLYNGRLPVGATMVLRHTRPAPGQTFDLVGEQVDPSGALLATMTGTTRGRVLEAGPIAHEVGLSLPSLVPRPGSNLRLRNIVLRASIDPDGRLSSGMIGGTLSVDEVAASMAAAGVIEEETGRAVLGGAADFDRDPVVGMCRSFSAAFSFTAVSAVKGEPQP